MLDKQNVVENSDGAAQQPSGDGNSSSVSLPQPAHDTALQKIIGGLEAYYTKKQTPPDAKIHKEIDAIFQKLKKRVKARDGDALLEAVNLHFVNDPGKLAVTLDTVESIYRESYREFLNGLGLRGLARSYEKPKDEDQKDGERITVYEVHVKSLSPRDLAGCTLMPEKIIIEETRNKFGDYGDALADKILAPRRERQRQAQPKEAVKKEHPVDRHFNDILSAIEEYAKIPARSRNKRNAARDVVRKRVLSRSGDALIPQLERHYEALGKDVSKTIELVRDIYRVECNRFLQNLIDTGVAQLHKRKKGDVYIITVRKIIRGQRSDADPIPEDILREEIQKKFGREGNDLCSNLLQPRLKRRADSLKRKLNLAAQMAPQPSSRPTIVTTGFPGRIVAVEPPKHPLTEASRKVDGAAGRFDAFFRREHIQEMLDRLGKMLEALHWLNTEENPDRSAIVKHLEGCDIRVKRPKKITAAHAKSLLLPLVAELRGKIKSSNTLRIEDHHLPNLAGGEKKLPHKILVDGAEKTLPEAFGWNAPFLHAIAIYFPGAFHPDTCAMMSVEPAKYLKAKKKKESPRVQPLPSVQAHVSTPPGRTLAHKGTTPGRKEAAKKKSPQPHKRRNARAEEDQQEVVGIASHVTIIDGIDTNASPQAANGHPAHLNGSAQTPLTRVTECLTNLERGIPLYDRLCIYWDLRDTLAAMAAAQREIETLTNPMFVISGLSKMNPFLADIAAVKIEIREGNPDSEGNGVTIYSPKGLDDQKLHKRAEDEALKKIALIEDKRGFKGKPLGEATITQLAGHASLYIKAVAYSFELLTQLQNQRDVGTEGKTYIDPEVTEPLVEMPVVWDLKFAQNLAANIVRLDGLLVPVCSHMAAALKASDGFARFMGGFAPNWEKIADGERSKLIGNLFGVGARRAFMTSLFQPAASQPEAQPQIATISHGVGAPPPTVRAFLLYHDARGR